MVDKLKNRSFTTFIELKNITKRPPMEIPGRKTNESVYKGSLYIEGKFIRHFTEWARSLNDLQLKFKQFIQNATKDAYMGNFPKTK